MPSLFMVYNGNNIEALTIFNKFQQLGMDAK